MWADPKFSMNLSINTKINIIKTSLINVVYEVLNYR